MRKKIDLTGQKFGRLTVLYEADPYVNPHGKKSRMWKCLCECGKEKNIRQSSLLHGDSQSCGCLQSELNHNAKTEPLDLTGQTYGRWTVLYEAPSEYDNHNSRLRKWYCKCTCGTERIVDQHSLRKGSSLSCGCLRTEALHEAAFKDITGRIFGRLTVIKFAYSKNNKSFWHCLCTCGTEKDIDGSLLRSGQTTSCGCYNKERVREVASHVNKRVNRYDLSNENYGIGYNRSDNKPFYFDKEDYELIKDYCWHINDSGYLVSEKHNKSIRMHRLILGIIENEDYVVDHINHCTVDNRKINLRITTMSHNMMNRVPKTDNISGCPGVIWSTKNEAWIVNIMIQKKNIRIGTFYSLKEAIIARKAAEEKYFGQYSYDNSQKYAAQYVIPEEQLINVE